MKKIVFFLFSTFLFQLFYSCGDCKHVVNVRGDYKLNKTIQQMFDYYKGKKRMVVKNANGDSIVFKLSYDTYLAKDTLGIINEDRVCAVDIVKAERSRLVLKRENATPENYFIFHFDQKYKYDYLFEKSTMIHSLISQEALLEDTTNILNYPRVGILSVTDVQAQSKLDYDTLIVGKKKIGYIYEEDISEDYSVFSEKEPIAAIRIPQDEKSGWWYVVRVQ
jgi:hypothetical protein